MLVKHIETHHQPVQVLEEERPGAGELAAGLVEQLCIGGVGSHVHQPRLVI